MKFCFSFEISFHNINNKTWAWQVILLKLGAHVELYGGELWHHQLQTWIQCHQKERKEKKSYR